MIVYAYLGFDTASVEKYRMPRVTLDAVASIGAAA